MLFNVLLTQVLNTISIHKKSVFFKKSDFLQYFSPPASRLSHIFKHTRR